MKAGVGDGVDATCTSWQSNPPANLSWFINGEPVRNNKGKHRSIHKTFNNVVLMFEVSVCLRFFVISG